MVFLNLRGLPKIEFDSCKTRDTQTMNVQVFTSTTVSVGFPISPRFFYKCPCNVVNVILFRLLKRLAHSSKLSSCRLSFY